MPTTILEPPHMSVPQKIRTINRGFVALLSAIALIGLIMLYSAGNGSVEPWAWRQGARFVLGMALLVAAAVTDLKIWMRFAYAIYGVALSLVLAVDIVGEIGMGAQRWLDLGFIQIQPSELMKVGLVLALARYFHGLGPDDIDRNGSLVTPLLLTLVPVALVLKQPDLGTASVLLMVGTVVFFAAGVAWWKFAVLIGAGLAALPIGWQFLHDYQKLRVLTFLDPERDPLGSGYHILQSKIAFGSGGVFGKGLLEGTQSHLNFLPEMQTDFIFTMLAEEFGLVGGLVLLGLYAATVGSAMNIAVKSRSQFGRLLVIGVISTFFIHIFVNMAMVMGLVPVVGVPLPLVSYGGTAMMTLLFAFGLILSVSVHRDSSLTRHGLD